MTKYLCVNLSNECFGPCELNQILSEYGMIFGEEPFDPEAWDIYKVETPVKLELCIKETL